MYVVTVPVTAAVLLRGQLSYLREHGFEVTVISSPGPELELVGVREGVRTIAIPMKREIDPWSDVIALKQLARELGRLAPDIVNASTAKAGLLGMIAAAAVRVPIRIYLLRGLRLETEHGVKHAILGLTEKVAAACASRVVCVSDSVLQQYVAAGFASAEKCDVLLSGSSNGVDLDRFAATSQRLAEAARLRNQYGIAPDAPIVGFVGRPVLDKGIDNLIDAFDVVIRNVPTARLLLVGGGFAEDAIDPRVRTRVLARREVIAIGAVSEPAPYYAMMDVLAFPSRREGFPNAPLEAAAASVPTVGFRATGVRDAVVHGETGTLVECGDVAGLSAGIERYLVDRDLRRRHGQRARERAVSEYARERVWHAWREQYEHMLTTRGSR